MIKLLKLASFVTLLSIASVTAQAGLIFDDVYTDVITGVDGIEIDGLSRTFDFVGGSHDEALGGQVYGFDTLLAASQIANMFFNRTGSVNLIRGCTLPGVCLVLLPIPAVAGGAGFDTASIIFLDDFSRLPFFQFFSESTLTEANPGTTFAVIRPAPVPDPSTIGLLGLSLLGLGFARRAQNNA